MGGLAGALIVDPMESDSIPAAITNADSVLIVVTHMIFAQAVDSNGNVTQGCGAGYACDPATQSPLCTGTGQRINMPILHVINTLNILYAYQYHYFLFNNICFSFLHYYPLQA